MTPRPKGGLGRGLSALIPDEPAGGEGGSAAVEIEVARIQPRPDQPRTRFDPQALQELTDSVRSQGVLVPLIVTPSRDNHYTLVAGERRLRAARAADLVTVPCRVIEDLDDRAILEISLVENLQREDLNAIELAEGYRRLIEDLGYTQQQVAERVGKDRVTVANTLRLLALPEPVRRMVVDGSLSQGHARALLMIEGDGERVALAHRAVKKGLTVRDVERLGKQRKETPARRTAQDDERRNRIAAREVAEKLQGALATTVQVQHKGPGGRVVLSYGDLDELDRLTELLVKAGTKGA